MWLLKGLFGNIFLGVIVIFRINFEFVGNFKFKVLYLFNFIFELL